MPQNLRDLLEEIRAMMGVIVRAATVTIKAEIKIVVQIPKVPLTMSSSNKERQALPMRVAVILAQRMICSQQQKEGKENSKEELDQSIQRLN